MSGTDAPAPLQRVSGERLIAAGQMRRRPAPTPRRIARHRAMVGLAKWCLPVLALALLGSIAAWPEINRVRNQAGVTLRRVLAVDPESGRMQQPRYRGVDQRGRPYTVSAASARETSPERLELTEPKGDVITETGTWLMVQARQGVYIQRRSLMDLAEDVVLYREDGTTLRSDTAALDLKAGAAASSDKTHAEGPFGVLDAQGFTLTDKGASIQFPGPAHLVLNPQK